MDQLILSHITSFMMIWITRIRYIENQAQTFAGLILVPKDKLINKIKKRIGHIPSSESVAILQPIINDLTDFFAVSEGVIIKRMRKEEILKNSW